MMMEMDIMKQKARKKSKIKKAKEIQEAYHFNDDENGYKEANSGKYVQNQGRSGNKR